MPSLRIACIFVPDFPLAAHLRVNPERRFEPFAIVDGHGTSARIVALSDPAANLGVIAGLSVPQAQAIAPQLMLRPRDWEAERSCAQALLQVADAFSPRVEDGGKGLAYLDTFRETEPMLGLRLIERARKVGLFVRVGVAASKLVARIAAQSDEDITVVPLDEQLEFLAALPIARLHPHTALALTLERWGLTTVGALAKLSERDVLSRLGRDGWQLYQQARGIDSTPLVPHPHTISYDEGTELEWEIGQVEPFMVIAKELLIRLLARLRLAELAVRRLEMHLKLEPQGDVMRSLELSVPIHNLDALLALVRRDMESRPLEAPVIGIRFHVEPERPKATQLSLFGSNQMSVDELGTALARLTAMLGSKRVGSPKAVDGPCPERFEVTPYVPPPAEAFPAALSAAATKKPFAAVRVLRPPIPLDVTTDNADKRPCYVRPRAAGSLPLQGTVQLAAGPWHIEDGWWTGMSAQREYWDISLSDQSLYRIYYDLQRSLWFADGMYD
jgi:protein ImuB